MLVCYLYLGSDNIAGGFIEVHMPFTRSAPTRLAALVHHSLIFTMNLQPSRGYYRIHRLCLQLRPLDRRTRPPSAATARAI